MRRKRLPNRWLFSLVIACAILTAGTVAGTSRLWVFQIESAERTARAYASFFLSPLHDTADLKRYIDTYTTRSDDIETIRILVIDTEGNVINDSAGETENFGNRGDLPAFRSAMEGTPSGALHFEPLFASRALALSLPLTLHDGTIAGVVEVLTPPDQNRSKQHFLCCIICYCRRGCHFGFSLQGNCTPPEDIQTSQNAAQGRTELR